MKDPLENEPADFEKMFQHMVEEARELVAQFDKKPPKPQSPEWKLWQTLKAGFAEYEKSLH